MCRSINNSKIYLKYTKTTDWMGQIRTVYLICTRITLEAAALRTIAPMHHYSGDYRPTSQIYQKLAKPIDRMGRIRTIYLHCTRTTLETAALRVTLDISATSSWFWRSSRKTGGKPSTWLPPGGLVER